MTRFETFADVPIPMRGKSHFVVVPAGDGKVFIEVRRHGELPYLIECQSPGEANRARLKLSAQGVIGFLRG